MPRPPKPWVLPRAAPNTIGFTHALGSSRKSAPPGRATGQVPPADVALVASCSGPSSTSRMRIPNIHAGCSTVTGPDPLLSPPPHLFLILFLFLFLLIHPYLITY